MQLSSLSLALTRAGIISASYDPRLVFGSDLVTYYGNSVDDLWRAQSSGGPVTLYQDDAGTTPVTAIGQSVGRINDLSGNGYHLTQSTATARMLLQTDGTSAYLDADGSDDFYITPTLPLSSVSDLSLIVSIRKSSDTTQGMFIESSPILDSNSGGVFLLAPGSNGAASYRFRAKGTVDAEVSATTYVAPHSAVLSCYASIGTPLTRIRVNGTNHQSTGTLGVGTFGNHVWYIGRRGGSSLPFNGRIYSLPMIVKRLMTADELAAAEKAFGKSIGVLQ